ncbi:MAG: SAM-dependent methyltransferase [Flavobacteriales bacterium]|jgi:16S rRNA (cytidine1402-2'-O)-methyltransferase|nr:MAG: SAM-dependent methyltransferase [Flavobacteriales bacterium]
MSGADGSGSLYLLPVWLGETGGPEQMPPENAALAGRITRWFCEHEKSARSALRRLVPAIDLSRLELHRFDKDSTPAYARELIGLLRDGRDAAVISEAGMPGIADPGASLVRAAHEAGIPVIPLTGPSALLLALAASGLNGQRFCFHGYLPVKPPERRQAINRLELEARRTGAAQLFIETPYRNEALLADMLKECQPATVLSIAVDATQPGGWIRTRTVAQWQRDRPVLGKRPAVFILGTWPQ